MESCRNCQNQLNLDDNFCSICGTYKNYGEEVLLKATSKLDNHYKWGFLNLKCEWAVKPIFDSLENFDKQGYCIASINKDYGFINQAGEWLIEPVFNSLENFDDYDFSLARLYNGKYGYINRKGEWLIKPDFVELWHFDAKNVCIGFIEQGSTTKMVYINRNGEFVDDFNEHSYSYNNSKYSNFHVLADEDADENGYINARKGVIDRYGLLTNEKYGFLNKDSEWLIKPIFNSLNYFDKDGYCPASITDGDKFEKHGFIGRDGNWIIEPKYESVEPFDEMGYSKVEYCSEGSDRFGIINRKGEWVLEPKFYEIKRFDLNKNFLAQDDNWKWGFINTEGDWTIEPKFDNLELFDKYGFCIAKQNKMYGILNIDGNWLALPKYKLLESTDTPYYKAAIEDKYGYIDKNGDWIIEPKFDLQDINSNDDDAEENYSDDDSNDDESYYEDDSYEDDDWDGNNSESYEDWLNNEFGEDAETAYWNMD